MAEYLPPLSIEISQVSNGIEITWADNPSNPIDADYVGVYLKYDDAPQVFSGTPEYTANMTDYTITIPKSGFDIDRNYYVKLYSTNNVLTTP